MKRGHYFSWKCNRKLCEKRHTNRSTNSFFENTKLPYEKMIQFVYFWIGTRTRVPQMMRILKQSLQTVLNWNEKCRLFCRLALNQRPKLTGCFHVPIQIDESYFAGKHKYNSGRDNVWDKKNRDEKKLRIEKKKRKWNNVPFSRMKLSSK